MTVEGDRKLNRTKYRLKKICMKFKGWLERNKIFFETIVMVSLTIMSIVVSWNANKIANEERKLTEREVEIEHAEKMPRFTMREHDNWQTYDIFNSGGSISDAVAGFNYYVCINVTNGKTSKEIVVEVFDAYQKMFANYDYTNNSFTNTANELAIYSTIMKNVSEWGKIQEITLDYTVVEVLEITYTDYIGETHIERYKIDTTTKSYMKQLSDEEYYSMMEKYELPIYGSKEKSDEIIGNSIDEIENLIMKKLNSK